MSELILSTVFPWLLLLSLLACVLILVLKIPEAIKGLLKLPIWTITAFIILLAAGIYVRFTFVPLDHRIYFDEDRYLSFAVTFARFGKATSVDLATPERLYIGIPDDAVRLTVPVLNAIVLKTAGFSEANLFNAAKVLSLLQIIVIFAVATIFTRRALVAVFAAAGMALLPTVVYWSVSIGLDSYFVLFSMLAVLAAVMFGSKPTLLNKMFLAASTFALLGVRLESFLMLPVITVSILFMRQAEKSPLLSRQDLSTALMFAVLIGIRAAASISVLGKKWCCAEALPLEAFSMSYMVRNIMPNLIALFAMPEFPFVLTLLAGFALLTRPEAKRKMILLAWILLYFLIYSFYYAGTFFTPEFSGSYGRYFLMLIPPLLILAGIGADEISTRLSKNRRGIRSFIMVCFLLLLIPTAINYRTMVAVSPADTIVEAGPRDLHRYLENTIIPKTPKNSVIIHNLTAYVLLTGRSVVFIGSFRTNKEAVDFVVEALEQNKPVYVVSAVVYECAVYPERCKLSSDRIDYEEVLPTTEKEPGLSRVVLKKVKQQD